MSLLSWLPILGKSDTSKKSSGKKSSHLNTYQFFEILRQKSEDRAYQDALSVIQSAPAGTIEAFRKIIGILTNIELPAQAPAPGMKPVKVFLLITGQTYQAHQQILNQLGSRVTCTDDPQQCDVILLFCPILSRVRSDVEAAFRKIPENAQGKNVVLVQMHHTRKPEQVLNQSRWKEEFPTVIQEVQVLYHETQNGLLQCPRNEQILRSMCHDLESMMKIDVEPPSNCNPVRGVNHRSIVLQKHSNPEHRAEHRAPEHQSMCGQNMKRNKQGEEILQTYSSNRDVSSCDEPSVCSEDKRFHHDNIETKTSEESEMKKPVTVFFLPMGQNNEAQQPILEQLNTEGSRITLGDDPEQCDVILLLCPKQWWPTICSVEKMIEKIPEQTAAPP